MSLVLAGPLSKLQSWDPCDYLRTFVVRKVLINKTWILLPATQQSGVPFDISSFSKYEFRKH